MTVPASQQLERRGARIGDAESGVRAAAELAAAEELAGLGTWRWRVGHSHVTCTAGLMAIIGADRAAVTARVLLRRVRPQYRPSVLAQLREARAGRAPPSIEIRIADLAGKIHILVITIRSDPNGADIGLFGVCEDVTTIRDVAAALDRSESRWEMALESAGQGVWDSDIARGVIYHSRTWRALRGMNPDGDPRDGHEDWLRRLHPDDVGRIEHDIRRQQTGRGEPVAFEYRERHMDGRYIWISSLGRPVERFADGTPSRFIGTDTDITQRKIAEEEMARLSRRLELALEVSQIGVFEADLTTGALFWDRRAREIYGAPLDGEMGPNDWDAYLHPDDAEMAQKDVLDAVREKRAFKSEFRIIRPDGEVRIIRTTGTYHLDLNGMPKMLGSSSDVTAEVAAKEELERAKTLAEARNAELETARASIEHLAMHDTLTGLANRRRLDDHLADRAAWCRRTGGTLAILHIDLDRFKQINDTLGHIAGDAMLVHVANLLRDSTAEGDLVARVGGDEFIIVCDFIGGHERIAALAEHLVAAIRRPIPYQGRFCRMGASIGVSMQSGAVDPERLMIDADMALYRAKGRGKNRYEFFSEALQAEAVGTKGVADAILHGIEQDEFFPFFQPLFDAKTLALVGVEALARWRHPTEGILSPAAFLKVAEDINAISTIDGIILKKALAQFDQWTATGYAIPAISVNVSFRRLYDPQLLANLRQLTIRPGTLSFELLESIFLDEMDETVSWNIDQIKDMGVGIDIDDFGTGHASIVSLLKLRPQRLKLDRQFTAGLTNSGPQRQIMRALIDIGKALSIKVIAEGVETEKQAEVLRELGCDALQGFLFARPMAASELENFLRSEAWRQAS